MELIYIFLQLDSLTLTAEHVEVIEKTFSSTSLGSVIWTYLGSFITGLITLLIFVIRYFVGRSVKKLEGIIKNKFASSSHDLASLKVVNENIDNKLTELSNIIKAERITFYQFQNGTHYFSSIPVVKISPTNYCERSKKNPYVNFLNYETSKDLLQDLIDVEYIHVEQDSQLYTLYSRYIKFSEFSKATLFKVKCNKQYIGVIEIIDAANLKPDEVKSTCIAIETIINLYNKK